MTVVVDGMEAVKIKKPKYGKKGVCFAFVFCRQSLLTLLKSLIILR